MKIRTNAKKSVKAAMNGEPTLEKLIDIVKSWIRLIDYAKANGNKYPTATLSDLKASMTGVLKDYGVTATCNGKKSVKASYGGWGKFYGLNDVEFTVPNDTDDPTIYYNGKYYNYYTIEDTLWDYYKDECAENGVSPDENEFEKWVADNSYYVYDLLDEIQPKSEPGRGVYRENADTLRKSIKSSRQRRAVKASYTYKYAVWVLDGDDNTWKCWSGKDSTDLGMSEDEFLDSINHQTYPNPEYNVDNNYVDVMVIDGDKTPADYGQTENVKEYGEIAESTRKPIKASASNSDVIAVLEDNGFEYANEPTPWWDKYMWLGFGATYNDETQEAYVWWNPNGNMVELPFNYNVTSVSEANAMCDDLYTWDEYNIDELLNAGLPLIGATSHENRLDEWDYDNGMGDTAYINTTLGSGTVTDAWGETTEYHNLQDLLEAAGIIR